MFIEAPHDEEELKKVADTFKGKEEKGMSFDQYTDLVGLPQWVKIKDEFSLVANVPVAG